MARKGAKTTSETWQDAIGTWEKSVNSVANVAMGGDEFSGVMNQAVRLSMLMQQSLGSTMATYLGALNLPAKTDIVELGVRLATLEHRLEHLTMLVERLAAANPATAAAVAPPRPPMPPRTRRPPSRAKDAS